MIKVLISAVGGDIGTGILKSLRKSGRKIKIIGCDINPYSAGIFLCDKGYIIAGAKSNPKKYIKDIIKICKKERIDVVFSAQPYEINVLSGIKYELQRKTGAYFVVQEKGVWDLSMDKLAMYNFLKKKGVPSPETYSSKKGFGILEKKYGYPLLVKARSSFGSEFHNYIILRRKNDFKEAFKKIKNPIIQQYISNKKNEEYTVGIFLDKNSKALGAISMLRQLRFGLTFHAVVDESRDIINVAIQAAQAIRAVGPCNVQLRRNKIGKPYVIEINARISSTAAFRSYFGFNESIACVDYFLNNKKPVFSRRKGVAMKLWDEIYIAKSDYDKLRKKGLYNRPVA